MALYQRLAPAPELPRLWGNDNWASQMTASAARWEAALRGRWDAAPDLERFLATLYQYYEVGGYWGILAMTVYHLVALAFTIGFSFVLLFFVDWEAILSCDSEESCRGVSLCYAEPFSEVGPWRSTVLLCFILFSVFWLANVAVAVHNMRDASDMSTYYKERLGIPCDELLSTMAWSEVVSRLVQQQKEYPFCVVQDELTALEIANIIMREDNFMIALTNHDAFTSCLPPWLPPRLVYTRAVLWNLRTVIFGRLFDHKSRIRQDFLQSPQLLASRMRWMGLLNLMLVGPVLNFVTIYFFMRHAEEFRSRRASPLQRRWSDYAKWTFREFNELPHLFKARMTRAQHTAEIFTRATKPYSPILDAARRCVKYVAGSILAVLLLVALRDDTPLLFVKIADKNLLWYLALFGFVFTVAESSEDQGSGTMQGTVPTAEAARAQQPDLHRTHLHMHSAMMRMVTCTHYLPTTWRTPQPSAVLAARGGGVGRAKLCNHFDQTRAEFLKNFFVHRIQGLLEELVGVLVTPLLLGVFLPEAAPTIVDIIRRSHYSSQNLGDWCAFGCLDPSRDGAGCYTTARCRTDQSQRRPDGLMSLGGKLEKSVLSFVLTHRLAWPRTEGHEVAHAASSAFSLPPAAMSPRELWAGQDRHTPRYRPPQAATQRYPAGASAREVTIPMQELGRGLLSGLGDVEASQDTLEDGQQVEGDLLNMRSGEGVEAASPAGQLGYDETERRSGVRDDCWGYPDSALHLLEDLEEFQQQEVAPDSAHYALYSSLPEELVRLQRVVSATGAGPTELGLWSPEGEVEHGSCSPHFFWLEALYDFQTGRLSGGGDDHLQIPDNSLAAACAVL